MRYCDERLACTKGGLLFALGSMGELTEVASAKRGVRGDLTDGAELLEFVLDMTDTATSFLLSSDAITAHCAERPRYSQLRIRKKVEAQPLKGKDAVLLDVPDVLSFESAHTARG